MAEVKTAAAQPAKVETSAAPKPKAEAKTYVCIKKCFWKNKLWKEGEEITTALTVPEHFEAK